MKFRSAATLTLAAFTLLAATSGALAATPEPAAKAATEPAAAPAAKAGPAAKGKPVLDKGMDAESILKHYGKPYEIKPMESPDKNTMVERWIYRRKVKETTVQTASGQTMVPAYSGFGGSGAPTIANVVVPEFRPKLVIIYQVTELLMINGRLEVAKQWMGQEEKYQ